MPLNTVKYKLDSVENDFLAEDKYVKGFIIHLLNSYPIMEIHYSNDFDCGITTVTDPMNMVIDLPLPKFVPNVPMTMSEIMECIGEFHQTIVKPFLSDYENIYYDLEVNLEVETKQSKILRLLEDDVA